MKFDLLRLDAEGATFKHFDLKRMDATFITIPTAKWERMGRPVAIIGHVEAPAERWFVEMNANDDPTIWDGDEPILSRSDAPDHWDELVARLGIAP